MTKTKDKSRAAGAARKPWGGDISMPRKPETTWFNDIIVACLSLPECLQGMDFAAFKASPDRKAAAMWHIHQIGEAASRQPASVRKRYPTVDWEALIHLKEQVGIPRDMEMTHRQVWGFVRKDAPVILQKLADEEGLKVAEIRLRDHGRLTIKDINRLLREGRRRSRRKDARAAAEARADARLWRIAERRAADIDAGRVAERRAADIDAGRVRAIPIAEGKRRLKESRTWKTKAARKP
jgi:uncharacterized protein with HEPN domain